MTTMTGARPRPFHWRSREERLYHWKMASALRLAERAGYASDAHGSFYNRGDHFRVKPLDFIPAHDSGSAPFLDTGGEGLALVLVARTRVYARSSRWSPSVAVATFLVGRNEAGTYFAHPVSGACTSVEEALAWMWDGKEMEIVARQGDIALVRGGRSGYTPELPDGHRVVGELIIHDSHPPLPQPGKGERIIVAKRANPFSSGTRD